MYNIGEKVNNIIREVMMKGKVFLKEFRDLIQLTCQLTCFYQQGIWIKFTTYSSYANPQNNMSIILFFSNFLLSLGLVDRVIDFVDVECINFWLIIPQFIVFFEEVKLAHRNWHQRESNLRPRVGAQSQVPSQYY